MIPKNKDLILKKKTKLYNNLAEINGCRGRLLAELEIYPTPRLIWEFEVLGETQGSFPYEAAFEADSIDSLVGYLFLIENPICTGISSDYIGPSNILRGEATQAVYGEVNCSAHLFKFYLPNTQFQLKRANQELILSDEGSYCANASIDESWEIRLNVCRASREWLDPKNKNIGTFITTVGSLFQPRFNENDPETFSSLREITLRDALKRLENLSRLLSYVNGGYVGPLYIEGYKATQCSSNVPQFSCATALSFQTTPLEKIGQSWLTNYSDLNDLLSCFSTFEQMMHDSVWRETFDFTLNQYFQAIQYGAGWSIRASAVGAALERLSYMILVKEETDPQTKSDYELLFKIKKDRSEQKRYSEYWNCSKYKKIDGKQLSQTGIRLSCLLETIGLNQDRDPDTIQAFLNVRNDAVHPIVSNRTDGQHFQLIRKATQWIDEILLWRIGYRGQYLDRSQNCSSSISPRYNSRLRDSDS